MEELYNSSKEAVEDGICTASNKANLNVRDPAIVKTKGDHGSTSNSHSHALGDAAVVKMLDTQGAYVHLHIFNKVNMLMVTTSLNPRNIQLLAHLIWKQIIIIFFNSEMLLGYLLDNI